jgi:hypothetical protein
VVGEEETEKALCKSQYSFSDQALIRENEGDD